ncbi:putative FAD dependent oxidoreductase [Colletotrichum karsti]|uniref:FAD dependent oxidoreductase n=1 Tax=Colletotrichum karsti TaxID=1095194 RepID=A0A9P6I468_9PEZI|nr:putative FAD dependent oxidoreductase [Colletotrichum karsti]KAF9873681.1 putative FAD dependent oxidoreductase [Colletotrichum karsti]
MSENTMSPFKVIIVGSGLAGSLLANGLARHQIDFQVYERQEKNSKREGFHIRLGESAMIGMRACLTQEHIDSISKSFACSSFMESPILYDKNFQKVFEPSKLPYYQPSTPINRVSLRDSLWEPLMEMGRIHFEKRFLEYEVFYNEDRQLIRVVFDDGTVDTCDVLIGADGGGSKVNRLVGLQNLEELKFFRPFFSKQHLSVSRLRQLPEDFITPVNTVENDIGLFFSVYVPRSMERIIQDPQAKTDREGITAMLGMGWYSHQMPQNFDDLTLEEKWDAVSSLIRDWSSKHHEIIDMFRGQEMYQYTSKVSSRPQPHWRERVASPDDQRLGNPHVWLIGDAMHAMLPARGMGGNQAMLDSADALPLLAELAGKSSTGSLRQEDFAAACEAYERAVIPRAFKWVEQSGGRNPTMIDTSKLTDRAFLRMMTFNASVMRLWNWLKSQIFGPNSSKQTVELL